MNTNSVAHKIIFIFLQKKCLHSIPILYAGKLTKNDNKMENIFNLCIRIVYVTDWGDYFFLILDEDRSICLIKMFTHENDTKDK